MIEKIELNQPLIESGISPKHPNSNNASTDNNTDASVHVDYACFINMAMQLPQSNTQQVERAREALISGQLDTPENTCKAAENITKYGI